MASFRSLLRVGWRRSEAVRWLAVVPLCWSLAQVDAVTRTVGFDGYSVGVRFPVPSGLPTLWTFARVPATGIVVDGPLGTGGILPPYVGLAVPVVLGGLLTAGYLGELHAAMTATHRRGFVENVARYGVQQMLYAGLVALVGLAVVELASASSGVVLLAFPAFFVLGYLFYATPFLLVTEERSLVGALERSYGLAVDGGAHVSLFVGYLLWGALVSVPVTLVFTNLGLPGVVLGASVTAPACLAFSAATLAYLDGVDGGGLGNAADTDGPGRGTGRRHLDTPTSGNAPEGPL